MTLVLCDDRPSDRFQVREEGLKDLFICRRRGMGTGSAKLRHLFPSIRIKGSVARAEITPLID